MSITSLKFSNYKQIPGLSLIDVQSPRDFAGPAKSWRIVKQPGGNLVKVYIDGTKNVLQVSDKNMVSPQLRKGTNHPGFGHLVEYGQESSTNDSQLFTIEKSGSMYLLKSKRWGNPVCTHWSGPLIQCGPYYKGAATHELGILKQPSSNGDFLFSDPVSITSLKYSNYKVMPGLSPINVQSPRDFAGPAKSWRIVKQPGGNFVKVYINGTNNALQVSEKNKIPPQLIANGSATGFGYLVEYGRESSTNDLQLFTIEKSGSMYLLKSKRWGNPVCTHWSGPLIQCGPYYRGAAPHELGISSLMR